MPLAEKIKSDTALISKTKDIVKQRNHFDTLSDNVFKVVKPSMSIPGLPISSFAQWQGTVKEYFG